MIVYLSQSDIDTLSNDSFDRFFGLSEDESQFDPSFKFLLVSNVKHP